MKSTITIQASDTLFFRDGRPFSMGDDTFAQSVFPPPPSVIYGALRSVFISNYLNNQTKSLDDAILQSENLTIENFALNEGGNFYFPMPKDLIVPEQHARNGNKVLPLHLTESSKFSSAKTPKNLTSNYQKKTINEPLLMELLFLQNYLNGDLEDLKVKKQSDFITSEFKIGIGRDQSSHSVSEGKLYRVESNRLAFDTGKNINHLKFHISYSGLSIPENGWIVLGGDRRVGFFENINSFDIPCPVITSKMFKIYFSTPAVFREGWKSETFLKEYGLKLIAAAIDRPLPVGGWDLKNKSPKAMVQCVPAGSVYYVEAESMEKANEIARQIHGKSISDNLNSTDYQKQGFGIAYTGNIKN